MNLTDVQKLQDAVFIKSFDQPELGWILLTNNLGESFSSLEFSNAIEMVRSNDLGRVGLSNFKQASMDNAEWDNL